MRDESHWAWVRRCRREIGRFLTWASVGGSCYLLWNRANIARDEGLALSLCALCIAIIGVVFTFCGREP